MMKRILLAGLLCSLPAAAHASAWYYAGQSTASGTVRLVDRDPAQVVGPVISSWTVTVYAVPNRRGAWADRELVAIDCSRRVMRSLTLIEYDKAGRTMRSYDLSKSGDWDPIVTDTMGGTLHGVVCGLDKDAMRLKEGADPIEFGRLYLDRPH